MTERTPAEHPIDQWSIERLLHGEAPGADATPAAKAIAAMVAAARTEATQAELAGESAALAAYAGALSKGRRFRRSSMLSLSGLLAGKVAAALAAGAVSLGGVAAAAYTGNLPDSLQNFAHDTVGAPAPQHHDATTPKGPDATGKAAFGLCTAYEATHKNGASPTDSVAFQNLIKAAGGADKVAAYCAAVPHPGKSSHAPSAKPSTHPGANPSTRPSDAPTAHPSGEPTPKTGNAPAHPSAPPASPGGTHRQ